MGSTVISQVVCSSCAARSPSTSASSRASPSIPAVAAGVLPVAAAPVALPLDGLKSPPRLNPPATPPLARLLLLLLIPLATVPNLLLLLPLPTSPARLEVETVPHLLLLLFPFPSGSPAIFVLPLRLLAAVPAREWRLPLPSANVEKSRERRIPSVKVDARECCLLLVRRLG